MKLKLRYGLVSPIPSTRNAEEPERVDRALVGGPDVGGKVGFHLFVESSLREPCRLHILHDWNQFGPFVTSRDRQRRQSGR